MYLRECTVAVAVPLALVAQPLAAEVTKQDDNGFVVRHEVDVTPDTKASWLALISPAKWWNRAHTWSGHADNLTIRPQAGGCFCEKIPEVLDARRATLEGSVEHMRVVQAYPEKALRMSGGLGPLQSEAVTGVLTITLSETGKGTRIVWEYVVGGYMRYETPVIAKAVDGVISQQLDGLADFLGRVEMPELGGAPSQTENLVQGGDDVAQEPPQSEPESVFDAIDAMARD